MEGWVANLVGGIVLALLTANGVVLWWLITKRVNDNGKSMDVLGDKLDLMTKSFSDKIEKMEANFKNDFLGLEKRISDECRDMEGRFSSAVKELDGKWQGQGIRLSEVSESIIALQRDMYKDFVPAAQVNAQNIELKTMIKEIMVRVEQTVEKMDRKLDDIRRVA